MTPFCLLKIHHEMTEFHSRLFEPPHLELPPRPVQQVLDRLKDDGELSVESPFQPFYLPLKIPMRRQPFAEFRECAHDLNINLNGAVAVENRAQHGHAVFGKGIRQILPIPPAPSRV